MKLEDKKDKRNPNVALLSISISRTFDTTLSQHLCTCVSIVKGRTRNLIKNEAGTQPSTIKLYQTKLKKKNIKLFDTLWKGFRWYGLEDMLCPSWLESLHI